MMKQNSYRFASALIHHSSFCIHNFPVLAGVADDPRYFQISLPVQP
jgi:hypothetical protein